MKTRILTFKPPRIAMLLTVVAAIAQWLTPFRAAESYSSPMVAASLGLVGFVAMMWAWWQFQQRQVAICPTEKTARLITDGIYRVTRNPMYLGMSTMLVGLAVWFGTLPFYCAAAIYFVIIDQVFCRYEEAKLEAVFGEDYTQYRNRVRRWI
jgi:protein-S-isoprenylcysteine O-methyltransferase Ste14